MSTKPLFRELFAGDPSPTGPPLSGEDLKRSGMESVERHTPEWYRNAFQSAVESFPRGMKFTVEDVRAIAGDPPEGTHYNAMGPLVRNAARSGLMKKTGYMVKAKRASLHSSLLAQWERL